MVLIRVMGDYVANYVKLPVCGVMFSGGSSRPERTVRPISGPGVRQDSVRPLDFAFCTDPVDATLKALGL